MTDAEVHKIVEKISRIRTNLFVSDISDEERFVLPPPNPGKSDLIRLLRVYLAHEDATLPENAYNELSDFISSGEEDGRLLAVALYREMTSMMEEDFFGVSDSDTAAQLKRHRHLLCLVPLTIPVICSFPEPLARCVKSLAELILGNLFCVRLLLQSPLFDAQQTAQIILNVWLEPRNDPDIHPVYEQLMDVASMDAHYNLSWFSRGWAERGGGGDGDRELTLEAFEEKRLRLERIPNVIDKLLVLRAVKAKAVDESMEFKGQEW